MIKVECVVVKFIFCLFGLVAVVFGRSLRVIDHRIEPKKSAKLANFAFFADYPSPRGRSVVSLLNTMRLKETEEWDIFTGKQFGYVTKGVRVTLGSRGTFYMNKAAFEALGSPVAVEMLFDTGRRRIGLRPVHPMSPHGFKIMPHSKGGYHRLSAASFCHHHSIFFKGTLLFHEVTIDDHGMMRLDLIKTQIVTRGAR